MDKKTIAALLDWFYQNERNHPDAAYQLSWRNIKKSQNPWAVLVSEVMLQQTTVATIAKRYPAFMAQFPTPEKMVAGGIDIVLDAWAGMGYYRRAHNLFAAAQMVTNQWHGVWPQSATAIKKLPGVGDYTARAITAMAFQQKTIPLDGNIIRVLSRFLKKDLSQTTTPAIKKLLAKSRGQAVEENILDGLVLPNKQLPKNFVMSDWVQAMMDLANVICRVENPSCAICPLQQKCLGKKHWQDYPKPKIKKNKPVFYGAVLICKNRHGEYLLERRGLKNYRQPQNNQQGLYQGLLAFPMTALVRNKKKLAMQFGEQLTDKQMRINHVKHHCVVHDLTHRRLVLSLVFSDIFVGGAGDDNTAQAMGNILWARDDKLTTMPLPSVMKKVIKQMAG